MRRILLLTAFAVMAGIAAFAQGVTSGSITGTVVDQKGSALPGATVLAIHVPSGTQYGTSARGDGKYSIPNARIGGPYKITISFVGYETKEYSDVYLTLGNTLNLPATLAEGGTQLQELVITGTVDPTLNADRTGAATNISNQQITQLPTLSRSFSDFTRLTPQSNGLAFGGRSSSFNNITIDGALFNNSFGLSSTVGGQTNSQPISLDAFDQIQVNIAPFDVRQGAFTGASINAVTRSGTNEFSGSVFRYMRNQSLLGYKVGTTEIPKSDFNNAQTGFRIGGPIIKNKLFFFVNGEIERRDEPSSSFVASRDGNTGANVSRATSTDLDQIQSFLANKFNYNAGPYENFSLNTYSDKFTVKLDYNLNAKHKINIKYNYLKSHRDVVPSSSGGLAGNGATSTRSPGVDGMPYKAAYYIINNNMNSVIAELNSTFSSKYSNNFNVGYSAFRDFRDSDGGIFPTVDIANANSFYTTFGYETFSANNVLNTNLFQFADNFTAYLGAHTITVGTSNEFYKFKNGFAQQYYGQYTYNSVNEFINDATDPNDKVNNASKYILRYSALPGGAFPWAYLNASQASLYAQDEWAVTSKFKLTYGLRVDLPIWNTTGLRNENAESLTFRDGEKIDVSKLPDAKPLYSPRVGFNWDVKGDRSTTVRGGTGIFTGRVPFVWLSNQLSNNGVLFGTMTITDQATLANMPFSPDVTAYIPANGAANTSYTLNSTVKDFKISQVYRSNIGVDQVLPGDFVMTVEGMYTKELNNIYLRDANLISSTRNIVGSGDYAIFGTWTNPTAANRDLTWNAASRKINPNVDQALVLDNTNKGYAYNFTAQLKKHMTNMDASLGYTYGMSKDVNSGGSTAGGIFSSRSIVGDPNKPSYSYSDFDLRHRIVASVNYWKEYADHFRTTVGLFYNVQSGSPISYIYSNDANGDGQTNDLIYIPRTKDEIQLVADGGRTADQVWGQLDAFIQQDPYLSKHRGQFAERNGARTPWVAKLDVRLMQDFYMMVRGKRNTLQLTLDVFNIGNLIDKSLGVVKLPSRAALLTLNSIDANGVPTYRFAQQNTTAAIPLVNSFRNNTDLTSRWQMQVGVRYIFN